MKQEETKKEGGEKIWERSRKSGEGKWERVEEKYEQEGMEN